MTSQPAEPIVSIVTPTFNQATFLEQTIKSVLEQDYPFIEYIVVDGDSTDDTRRILSRYADRIRIVSEPDRGQGDAINKGFRLARGSIMGWLNSDDLYLAGAIAAVVRFFKAHPEIDFVYGDALAMDTRNRLYGVRAHVRQTNYHDLITQGDFIVQPAAFWRSGLWREIGELDTALRYTLDYDYWLRAARKFELRYVPVCLAAERLHSGAKTARGGSARLEEVASLSHRHGYTQLPLGFREQAAAEAALRGIRRLVRLDRCGWDDLRAAAAIQPRMTNFLKYAAVSLLAGEHSVPRFSLLLNRTRQRLKASTVLPREFLPEE